MRSSSIALLAALRGSHFVAASGQACAHHAKYLRLVVDYEYDGLLGPGSFTHRSSPYCCKAAKPKPSIAVSDARDMRSLHVGGEAIQSAMRLGDPYTLALYYTRWRRSL